VPPQAARDREAVHLDEELVDHAHAGAAAHPCAHDQLVRGAVVNGCGSVGHGAPRADGVDLVDEDHRAAVLVRHHAGLLEQTPDLQVADTDEHVREPRAGGEQERHAGGARDRLGHQRLAGPGWALEQDPVRRVAAHLLEVLEPFEHAQDLLRRLDRGGLTADVVEGGVVLVGVDHVVVAAREEPEHRAELEDDEEDQDHRLQHERPQLAHDELGIR
jgi:hypothetical protein